MIKNLLELKKDDILSVVGSGGKTTTMFSIGKELSNSKVLLTTSVKIFRDIGNFFTTIDDFKELLSLNIENGIYLSGNTVENNKFTGISNKDLDNVKGLFDYIVIESDGAKNMSLTGWRNHEPVILDNSNKTLGIIPIDIYNEKIEDIDIFERELFLKVVGRDKYRFDLECIYNLIVSSDAIFKNSKYEKFILLNKCDDYNIMKLGSELLDVLRRESKIKGNIKIIYGSSIRGRYYEN